MANYDFSEYNYQIDQFKKHSKRGLDYVRLAIEALIIAGYPRHKISQKLKEDLEGLLSPDRIQHICAEAGATDPKKASAKGTRIEEVDFGDGTKGWRRVDDPDKPKGDGAEDPMQPIAGARGTPSFVGSPDWSAHTEENLILIEAYDEKIELLEEIIKKLKSKPFLSKMSANDRKEVEEIIFLSKKVEEMVREAWDDRQSIPLNTQILLAKVCVDELTKHSAKKYLAVVKEINNISAKQILKTLSGVTRECQALYEPTDQQEALENGFYGKPCPAWVCAKNHPNPPNSEMCRHESGEEHLICANTTFRVCGSYRVKNEHGWNHCFACEHDYKAKAEKLPMAGKKGVTLGDNGEPEDC